MEYVEIIHAKYSPTGTTGSETVYWTQKLYKHDVLRLMHEETLKEEESKVGHIRALQLIFNRLEKLIDDEKTAKEVVFYCSCMKLFSEKHGYDAQDINWMISRKNGMFILGNETREWTVHRRFC